MKGWWCKRDDSREKWLVFQRFNIDHHLHYYSSRRRISSSGFSQNLFRDGMEMKDGTSSNRVSLPSIPFSSSHITMIIIVLVKLSEASQRMCWWRFSSTDMNFWILLTMTRVSRVSPPNSSDDWVAFTVFYPLCYSSCLCCCLLRMTHMLMDPACLSFDKKEDSLHPLISFTLVPSSSEALDRICSSHRLTSLFIMSGIMKGEEKKCTNIRFSGHWISDRRNTNRIEMKKCRIIPRGKKDDLSEKGDSRPGGEHLIWIIREGGWWQQLQLFKRKKVSFSSRSTDRTKYISPCRLDLEMLSLQHQEHKIPKNPAGGGRRRKRESMEGGEAG